MRKFFLLSVSFIILLLLTNNLYALCVKVPEANLRSGPGIKNEKTWKVYKYMPFKKLESKGGWYRVKDVDGDVHWIFGNLVTDKFKCAVVKADKVNVRSGPGTNFKKTPLSPVIKYYSFKVTGKKKEWVNVSDEYNNSGWISKNLLWIQ